MTYKYLAGVQKVTGAAAGPIVTLAAGSAVRPDIIEIGIFLASAPASGPTIGFGRPAAAGVGAATGALGQAGQTTHPAAGSTLASSFATTQPTAPSVPMARITLPPAIGAGMVWRLGSNDLVLPASGNVVVWQFSALAVTYETYMVWEE